MEYNYKYVWLTRLYTAVVRARQLCWTFASTAEMLCVTTDVYHWSHGSQETTGQCGRLIDQEHLRAVCRPVTCTACLDEIFKRGLEYTLLEKDEFEYAELMGILERTVSRGH